MVKSLVQVVKRLDPSIIEIAVHVATVVVTVVLPDASRDANYNENQPHVIQQGKRRLAVHRRLPTDRHAWKCVESLGAQKRKECVKPPSEDFPGKPILQLLY